MRLTESKPIEEKRDVQKLFYQIKSCPKPIEYALKNLIVETYKRLPSRQGERRGKVNQETFASKPVCSNILD